MLIYKDGLGLFVARLTDFGYSTRFADDNENIAMPKSWPWCAPEHHHRGFKPDQAMNMDMFSFGVLTLWIMYKPYLSGANSLPPNMAWASKYVVHHAECGDLETIDNLKNNEKLAKFSQGLVEVDLGLEDAAKLQLEGFFGVMLLCDPVAREAELRFQG